MQLRRRLERTPETVLDFELAAEQRYWDGMQLLVAGRTLAGVYLLGYTAEMLLKLACFRLEPIRPNDPVAGFLDRPGRSCERTHRVFLLSTTTAFCSG